MIQWRNNINKAIIEGFFYTTKGTKSGKLKLTAENAANWVGVVIEAENPDLQEVEPGSGEYINRDLYGSVHNNGHDKFAEIGFHEYTSGAHLAGCSGCSSTPLGLSSKLLRV